MVEYNFHYELYQTVICIHVVVDAVPAPVQSHHVLVNAIVRETAADPVAETEKGETDQKIEKVVIDGIEIKLMHFFS